MSLLRELQTNNIYEKITGTKLDLTIEPEGEEEKK